ncbi:pyocin knob domain-containing protein [Lactobacillus crispatus]|uniref:pyocin knob domain-containing protein n=1 Tax=Lactobacillus crispatus TaxID=47770 RepID=UPI00336A1A75
MDKFKDTIITDAGRKLLINVGAGNGEIAYTRAVLAGQDVSSMADEDIRKLATLENQKMEVNVIVTPPQDNTITVSASFGNKDLTDDLTFSSVGWYAKNNNDNKEILLGVSPSNGEQTLAAGSPDHRSTASIDIDLAMAISNAAKVDLTVNEIGVAHMSDVNAAILKLKAEYDPKIEQAGKVKGAKINDGAVVEPDDDGILDLIVDSDRIKDLPAGLTDLNNLTESGMYRLDTLQNSVANRPPISPLFLQKGFLKVISDAKTKNVVQFFVTPMGSNFVWLRGRRGDGSAWSNWNRASSTSYSNDDIKNLINSKVDGLNVGQFIKKVNGLTPDGSGNVNVTSTVARGFDANANVATKETVENLHGGNQILLDQNAGQDIVNWTKGQLNGKLSTSGGDMDEHSTINWNGAGDVNSHDGNIGGLTWSGATDNVRLFADNDANDNLDLVIQLGDDNSNAVVIRNSTGAQVARVDASGNISSPTINDLQRQINDLKEDNVNKQKQINDLINNVTYIKDNYVEGRRFPASQEAQAQAWENEKPTRLAMIEK